LSEFVSQLAGSTVEKWMELVTDGIPHLESVSGLVAERGVVTELVKAVQEWTEFESSLVLQMSAMDSEKVFEY